jgi:hypothetical protein
LAATSGYIWLPFKFDANDRIAMTWVDSWNLNWF